MRLLRLDAYDTLLHQVAHLHVQEEGAILRAHLREGERERKIRKAKLQSTLYFTLRVEMTSMKLQCCSVSCVFGSKNRTPRLFKARIRSRHMGL